MRKRDGYQGEEKDEEVNGCNGCNGCTFFRLDVHVSSRWIGFTICNYNIIFIQTTDILHIHEIYAS